MPADAISSTAPRSSPVHGEPGSRPCPSLSPAAPSLLDEAAAGPLDRILIIGAPGPDLLCDALRRTCRATLEPVALPTHPEPADVVVSPCVAGVGSIALCARRALARFLAGRLRACGFEGIERHPRSEGAMLLLCLLPGAGPVRAQAKTADWSGGRRS